MASWSLSGKVILITGAAAGIGAAGAKELAARGTRPVLADLDGEGLARTAAEIGADPLTVELDVTDLPACERAVVAALDRHGRLDAVWANAGIASSGSVLLTDSEAWRRTIDVNVTGTFNTVRAALPAVIEQRGLVAVTASLASFVSAPFLSAYCATKSAGESFANALRLEVAHLGVDVCTIHPSWVATAMVEETQGEIEAFARLRSAFSFPMNKTYPVERVARGIAGGFERRSRRICTPAWVRGVHVARAALSNRLAERDLRQAAPEIDRVFAQEVAREGAKRASVTERTREQVSGAPSAH